MSKDELLDLVDELSYELAEFVRDHKETIDKVKLEELNSLLAQAREVIPQ